MYKFNQNFIKNTPRYGVQTSSFTNIEIEEVIFLEKVLNFEKGLVGQSAEPQEDVRTTNIAFIPRESYSDFLWQKLANLIMHANYDLFLYDIDHIENLQYCIYNPGDGYDWHIDSFPEYLKYNRVISGTLMLSNPDDYEGGEFDVHRYGNPTDIITEKPKRGEIIFFDSKMPHRVRKVTSGVRKSLVFWVRGVGN